MNVVVFLTVFFNLELKLQTELKLVNCNCQLFTLNFELSSLVQPLRAASAAWWFHCAR